MKESDILHQNGDFWVFEPRPGEFHVMRSGATHSETESVYADKSLAIARGDYLARRDAIISRDAIRTAVRSKVKS